MAEPSVRDTAPGPRTPRDTRRGARAPVEAGTATGTGTGTESGTATEAGSGFDRGPRASRGAVGVAALVVGAVLLTASGVVAGSLITSPAQLAADAGPPPPDVLTARVERRVLRETVVLRGTVVAGQTVRVAPLAAGGEGGVPVVTKVPVAAGEAVRPGQVVLEVSGRPVVVLKGRLPVYRDLRPGATGDDVAQLQDALASLGHGRGDDPRGTFGAGTKRAVAEFYSSAGYDPRPAVADDGAAVDGARRAVTGAERAAEDTRDALLDTADATQVKALRKARDRAAADLADALTVLAAAKAAAGPMVPAAEIVFVERFPARVASVDAAPGSPVTGPLMTLSSGRLVVQGYLQDHQKGMVRPGRKVRILDEETGAELTAEVAAVAGTATRQRNGRPRDGGTGTEGGEGDGPTADGPVGFLLTAVPDREIPAGLAGKEVRLTVEAASTDGAALVVPVTAVSAGADGRTLVTTVRADGRQDRVEVRTGTLGDGYVEVVPLAAGRLAEGEAVVTGVAAATGVSGVSGAPGSPGGGPGAGETP
ncbi:peptidoglycan-binding protein [Streptomyces sp. NPDC059534]|uniref:peptidoglycan-binding protein n=1 Tax=Streptomyces sp. NPDC059534 TaxID=3346859 RepID=UPI003673E281